MFFITITDYVIYYVKSLVIVLCVNPLCFTTSYLLFAYDTFPPSELSHNACVKDSSSLGVSLKEERDVTHGAMSRRIDPSWGGPIELFLVPASAPRLV